MNIRMLVYILGKVLLIEGALMLMPVICGLFYGEVQIFYYIGLAAIYIGVGFLISLKKPKNMTIFIKDGCVATALSWLPNNRAWSRIRQSSGRRWHSS